MPDPIQWTARQLADDARQARDIFRAERLEEPLELYNQFFDAFVTIFGRLIDRIGQLAKEDMPVEVIADTMSDDETRMAFRYLTAPPSPKMTSKTLADAKLSPTALPTRSRVRTTCPGHPVPRARSQAISLDRPGQAPTES